MSLFLLLSRIRVSCLIMCRANADCGLLLLVGIWLVDSVESIMMHGFGKNMSMKNSNDTIGN